MDPRVESLGKSPDNPDDHSISLPLGSPEDSTSLEPLIASFPSRNATKSICRRWITNLAATRELDDKVDESAIHCLGRDLWDIRFASDAMALLSDQQQMTQGMKSLLAKDMEITKRRSEKQDFGGPNDCIGFCAFIIFIIFMIRWAFW